MSKQKDYVNRFLNDNFDRIEKERLLNSFSWKPILQQILAKYPEMLAEPKLTLNPDDHGHRDRVRNNFLNIRRRRQPLPASKGLLTSLSDLEREQYIRETPQAAPVHVSPTVPLSWPNSATKVAEAPEFKYLDTYNKPQSTPLTEADEIQLFLAEKRKLKSQQGMHIVIGCLHLPAQNKAFYKAFLQFVCDSKPLLKGIHLIGDILDCKSLSQHDNGQVSDGTLEEEYDAANLALDELERCLAPGIEKNYLWGNHEQRYERIIKRVDIAKFGGALMSPTRGCKFVERGYTVQEDYKNAKIQLGKYLDLIHGEYITANASKKHLDVYKKSIMFAHTHKMGAHFDGDKAAFNIGWMGDKDHSAFGYCSRITKGQWQNGFAVVNIDEDGFYHVQLVQWYNGQFIFGNKTYR